MCSGPATSLLWTEHTSRCTIAIASLAQAGVLFLNQPPVAACSLFTHIRIERTGNMACCSSLSVGIPLSASAPSFIQKQEPHAGSQPRQCLLHPFMHAGAWC
jgi:hypothetical protein